jgi:hypothetical protein
MLAPKVATRQTKVPENLANSLGLNRKPSLTANGSIEHQERAGELDSHTVRGPSWDFSKISVLPSDRSRGTPKCACHAPAGPAREPGRPALDLTSRPLRAPAAVFGSKNSLSDGAVGGVLGGLAGAAGGALIGALAGGPIGAVIGALAGGLIGAGIGAHVGGAAGKPAAGCAAGQSAASATACIQPVVIAEDDGTRPTTATSTASAVSVWGKCCEKLSVSGTKTVKKASFKTLEESPSNTPSAEEAALFTAAGSSSCIQVFQPAMLKQGATTSKDVSGGGGTYFAGTANPKIVLVEGAAPEVLAHEVGHALGHSGHDTNATVMKPTGAYNVANATAVSADVCTKARTGSVLTIGPTADCCETIP